MDRKRGLRREERAGWAAAQGFSLTERDVSILYALGRCRVLRTREIARLFFGSRATTSDRLRKLFVAGLVTCHVRELATDNLYVLSPKGRAVVVEQLGVEARELAVVRALPARLDHLLAINAVRILFTAATRDGASVRLVSLRAEWELARERHAGLLGVLPDLVLELEERGRGVALAVEADTGTEAPTVVAKKLMRYEAYRRSRLPLYGLDVGAVVLAAPSERRLKSLARAVPSTPNLSVRFLNFETANPRTLFVSAVRDAAAVLERRGP